MSAPFGPQPIAAQSSPQNSSEWRLIGLNPEQHHFSPLEQIHTNNVAKLGVAWFADLPSKDGLVGVPLVADGGVYQSGPLGRVYANDVRTGRLLWTFDAKVKLDQPFIGAWGHRVNRGAAVWGDKVYVGTGDCRLIAIDRKLGTKVWEAQSCDTNAGNTITGPPHVGAGKIFIGNATADLGIGRGFVDAFDAQTGRRLWRFYTIPGDPSKGYESKAMEMAARTWGKEYRQTKQPAGGAAWNAMTYDPVLNLLYIGTDSPSPMNPKLRGKDAGEELFTNAIVAVNADTGEYVWHYSTTPHDAWNYAATMHIMIAELQFDGKKRRVVMEAPKNGFFYVLDAKTGKLISANNLVPVNWASHIDLATGRPVQLPAARWYEQPNETVPWVPGGRSHSWQPMSYSPLTGLVYIPVTDAPMTLTMNSADKSAVPAAGADIDWFAGERLPEPRFRGELVAWDPIRQRERWRQRVGPPTNGGVLSTASNLVFQGTGSGELRAYQADTGKVLWQTTVHSGIYAAPSTVEIDGEQLVLVSVGSGTSSTLRARPHLGGLTRGPSRLVAFKLGGTVKLPLDSDRNKPLPKPAKARFPAALAAKGRAVWNAAACGLCHGDDAIAAEESSVPDLRKSLLVTSATLRSIVIEGLLAERGMPSFKGVVPTEDLPALEAFIVNQAWLAYEAQRDARTTRQ